MIPREMASATIFEIKSDAMRPHAKSGSFVKRSGPGLRPHIMRPPRRTAPVPDPGIPRARSGAKLPAAAALFADSDAAIPSIAPVPRGSSLLNAFCIAYARKDAAVAPAPGRTPTNVPMIPALIEGGVSLFQSCAVSIDPRIVSLSVTALTSLSFSSMSCMSWANPTVPITNGMNSTPPRR